MSPNVSILMRVDDGDIHVAQNAINQLRTSLGAIEAEIVLVDATIDGLDELTGVTVVRETSPCRATGWKAAARHARAPYVTWHDPRTVMVTDSWPSLISELESHSNVRVAVGEVEVPNVDTSQDPSVVWMNRAIVETSVVDELDEVLYAPNETSLFNRLREQGVIQTVNAVTVQWPAQDYTCEEARVALDHKWLSLDAAKSSCQKPEMSVIICTYNRRATLLRCLESFCRQLVSAGTFEIIITDDESPDGTASVLTDTTWPVPVKFIARSKGSLAQARNEAIAVAEGKYLLLINDDTIAYPNLIEQHLAVHREVGEDNIAVLGTFDQPPAVLENALMRAIEHSSFGFPYEGMQAETFYNWHKFWTCNLSVPTNLVRQAGCFDEDYDVYGCEDSDLGYRLEQKGLRVFYTERARAFHDHNQDLSSVCRRQKTLARANVKFFAKNPEALNESVWQGLKTLTAAHCEQGLRERRAVAEAMARAAQGLSQVSVGALEALQGSSSDLGEQITKHLLHILNELNNYWWLEGSLQGFHDLQITGYPDIVAGRVTELSRSLRDAGGQDVWPLSTEAKKKILAWPQFDDDDLRALFLEYGPVLAENPDFCLCIRHDARIDGPVDVATEALQQAFDRYVGAHRDMDVLLVTEAMTSHEWPRLGRAVDATIILPSSARATRRAFYSVIDARPLTSSREVQSLLTPMASSIG